MRIGLALVSILAASAGNAEVVEVEQRGEVDLRTFVCESVPRSAIRRVCFDETNNYVLIQLGTTYRHYCGMDSQTVYELLHTEHPSKYFLSEIRGRFDCRRGNVPPYN